MLPKERSRPDGSIKRSVLISYDLGLSNLSLPFPSLQTASTKVELVDLAGQIAELCALTFTVAPPVSTSKSTRLRGLGRWLETCDMRDPHARTGFSTAFMVFFSNTGKVPETWLRQGLFCLGTAHLPWSFQVLKNTRGFHTCVSSSVMMEYLDKEIIPCIACTTQPCM